MNRPWLVVILALWASLGFAAAFLIWPAAASPMTFLAGDLFLGSGLVLLWRGRRRRAASAPRQREDPRQALLEGIPEAICRLDGEGRIVWGNAACANLLGRSTGDLPGLRVWPDAGMPPGAALSGRAEDAPGQGAAGDLVLTGENRAPRHLRIRRLTTADPAGGQGDLLHLADVSELRRLERQAAEARRILDHLPAAVCIADAAQPDLPLSYVNEEFERLTGYGTGDALGRNCRFLQKEDRDQRDLPALRAALADARPAKAVLRNYRKDGRPFLNEIRVVPLSDDRGRVTAFCGTLRDISAEAERVRRAEALAFRDAVTGLLTKAGLQQRLSEPRVGWACLLMDVDRLREINATYGRRAGDALLQLLAERLKDLAGEEGLAARMDGGSFALLWPAAGDLAETRAEAERRLRLLTLPCSMPGYRVFPHLTGGLSSVDAGDAPLAVVERADAALYAAKEEAPGRLRVYDAALGQRTVARVKTTEFLRDALQEGQLSLRFQPKVAVPTGGIVGAEALVRWQHPVFGEQSAASFIPVAEQSGLIVPIGLWVLKETAAQIRAWLDRGFAVPPIAVNVSRAQLSNADFVGELQRLRQTQSLDDGAIVIELTESVLAGDDPDLADQLRLLRRLGYGLALDDFGKGYSSLGAVRRLPLTELKVDGAFVQDIDGDPYARSVVQMVVRLAAGLGVPATAEGVERAGQAAVLAELGCPLAQGYYYSAPLAAADLAGLLGRGAQLPERR